MSQIYQTIEFERLAALAPFATEFHLEKVVVDSAKKLDLEVRVQAVNAKIVGLSAFDDVNL